ncbi:Lipopolysaccharide-responsive and beige-like anchor protein [Phytophthora ramorum]|uniref:Lipopolysaccharide-responsive and beige-like anchor protein n=1 Tax=Phytophthora ramorum TaxID=164328 RepID=UPI0030B73658|nr:Lipopolysaccharide-responsive and beige-like anchor protein [Phytophthora ramorum]
MDEEKHEKQNLQASRSDSDDATDEEKSTVEDQPSDRSGGAEMAELSPSKAAHELVRKTMLACFVGEKNCASSEREQLIRDVQKLTRTFAKRLLLAPEESSQGEEEDSQSQYVLPRGRVVPPSAYFSFQDNGRMHLPIVDWSAFRGYSVAVWINVDFCLAQAKKEGSTVEGVDQKDLYAKFNLFRFTNGSNTLGVEASLEYTEDLSGGGNGVLLNVSCCAPGTAGDAKKSASIAASSSFSPEWRRIQQEISLAPGEWHLLVISHSLHYVKKSKVTCHVDNKLQFKEELVYPSGLVTASKCTVGGGRNVKAKIASVAMYQEELSRATIELMYALGPMVSSFNRWAVALPAQSSRLVAGTHERALGPSPLSVPENEAFTAFCKLQVVFAFNAQNTVNEDYADLGVEWLSEGTTPSTNGKWLALESTVGASAEIQQRNARLGKSTQKMIFPEYQAAWYRSVGVSSLPVLLDYILTAYERIRKKEQASESAGSAESTGPSLNEERPLSALMESVVVDFLWILKGMLLGNVANQQEVLQNYVFHTLSHVMVQHKDCLSVIWTPGSLVVCVEMVKSLFGMMPSPKKSTELSENHPFHVSVWTTNPLFASGVRAVLMDYRLWTQADYKTQSIYNHQVYGLACEYPQAFNNMQAVPKVLEILERFYSVSHALPSPAESESSQNSQQLTESDDKDHHWKQQSIQSLVEVIEVCLTNQSTQVHEVLEQEVMETTFARASTPAGAGGGSTASGSGPSPSASTPSSTSTSPSMLVPGHKGGVFSINLESIVWSDQSAPGAASFGAPDGKVTDDKDTAAKKSILHSIQVRFSLVRDIRAVVRFLMTSKDAAVCTSILLLLRRLAVSFLDMRFALISSSIMDCLLYLMHDQRSDAESNGASTAKPEDKESSRVSIHVRMACVPLFIYLLDWLESIEGRTVWCGLEEHLRLVLNGHGSFSVGFLELMMEFYFDPAWLLGVQHSIIMNDPSKKDSLLFPIAPVASNKSVVAQENGIEDGIAVTSSSLTATGEMSTGIGGLIEWIKMANQFVGKRLQLTWEKRAAVIRLTALRSLSNVGAEVPGKNGGDNNSALVADMFDEGVSGILSLPLKGILPFLPILLGKSTPHFREKVLMDINVKLKTDEDLQQQLLLMKKSWADALLELSLTCSVGVEIPSAATNGEGDCDNANDENCGRAYSFDASKTGEDLVLDTIVSLLCMAMSNTHGWRSFTHLLLALKGIQAKYNPTPGTANAPAGSSLPPLAQVAPHVNQSELFREPLNWVCRVVAIVLQRMARSRTILSRTLAENVQRLLFLVHETLLAQPLKLSPAQKETLSVNASASAAPDKFSWSDAQLLLLNAVLDICARLIDSTHKMHRVGLFPGLQILQYALPYVFGKTMMERVVGVLVQSFQQELTAGSALRVYESVPTRDVFLRALVDLRRALVVHKKEELLVLLRGLTLRICTSGSFDEELGVAGLSTHELGELTEQQAVEVVLDALALAINDTELHEREEVEDMVPYFPIAKELRSEHDAIEEVADLISPTGKKYSNVDSADDSERVLWAALEVEENRMLATLRDVTSRERQRAITALTVQREQKQEWTQKLWLKQEFTFRSQNQYDSLRRAAPETLATLQKTLMWRLGLYETPFPSRMRRTVDLDLQLSFEKLLALEAEESTGERTEEKKKLVKTHHRQSSALALPLEMLHSFDGDTEGSPTSPSNAGSGENLLERVGRVVAQQRGGEIRDITSDDAVPASELADTYVPSTDNGDKGGDEAEARVLAEEEHLEEYKSDPSVLNSGVDDGKPDPSTTTTGSKGAALLGQGERGLDPGAGIAVAPDDQVYACVTCRRVVPEGVVLGRLSLCGKHIVFEPQQELPESARTSGGGIAPGTTDFDESTLPVLPDTRADEAAPGLHRCWRWKYTHLVGVYLRRYRLRDSAIEVFLRNGSTHFLDFPLTTKQRRNEFVRVLYSFLPRSTPKQWPGRVIPHLATTTKAWQNRQISNFDYLMALNTFAGRSFNDLTQYPVFPWVLSNYEDSTLDLSDPHNFRDLSKPVGALNAARLEEYWERYHSFDDPVIPKFLYGSHYSTCAGVVLFFLFRLEPFASLHQKMQGGTFDLSDRLFFSIQETWRMCNSQMSEVKELTPEFFASDGTFLRNRNGYALGKRHDQKVVGDVQLPKWASTPEEFVRIHRAALESEHVSRHLHLWIDLIFGYKQRGRASLQANNVFYYLTYYGVVDLDKVEDPFLRESMELQIAHFGQCPMQLFATPHPKRHAAFARSAVGKTMPGTVPNKPVSGRASPPLSGGFPGKEGGSTGPSSNIPRPLSLAFQDFSPVAQEKRRNWSPVATVKPIAQSGIRLLKILPDRVVSVNELGVIEIYYWKLLPKPAPPLPSSPQVGSASTSPKIQGAPPKTFFVGESVEVTEASRASFSSVTDFQRDSEVDALMSELSPSGLGDEESGADAVSDCPWLLEVVRDDSPFDYVPRIPVFDHVHHDEESVNQHTHSRGFPVVISRNGRVLVSGGARSGALHFRLLDLDNGHVIGKASVVGHSAAVTCLSLDRWSYHSHSQIIVSTSQEDEELLVSGSQDGTLALWRLSRVKPDMLFRLPRVSPRPIIILRGHATPIVDCSVSTYLGVVVSCSHSVGLAHFLFDEGQVAFVFEPAEAAGELTRVRLSVKGYIIAITAVTRTVADDSSENGVETRTVVSSVCQIFNLSGVLILSHHLPSEEVLDVQVSAEGDLIFLTLSPGIIRICRIEDFVTVQEYDSPSTVGATISATCFGPKEAVILLASGHSDGTLSLQLLPDASGSVSFLANVRRLLGVSSKLKRVKGTVQHAQTLAMSTIDNAKAVTSTARDIAGEALGEAKVMMRGLFSYLQKG